MTTSNTTTTDQGLRDYMLGVYNHMGIGLILSGFIAYMVATVPALTQLVLGGPQVLLFIFAPLLMVFWLSYSINKISVSTAKATFYAYAAIMGASLSTIFMHYRLDSVVQVFFISSISFLATSVYGYVTKRDLTALGGLMFMGLIGIIVAMLVNLFMQNTMFDLAISCVAVVVFVGLTAYDTQKIKEIYYQTTGDDQSKAGIMGALNLYLDFVNLMLHLLRLFGVRK